jgi:hypothetical protein
MPKQSRRFRQFVPFLLSGIAQALSSGGLRVPYREVALPPTRQVIASKRTVAFVANYRF